MRRVCCKCNLVLDPGDGTEGGFTSHTYCDICYDAFMAELDVLEASEAEEAEEKGE